MVISYEDFDLRLQANGDALTVSARRGSQTASEPFQLDSSLSFDIEDLESRGRETIQRSGAALFDALFRGTVRSLYQQARGSMGNDAAKGVRFRIHVDGRDERLRPFLRLPWELVFDATANANPFLAIDARRPIVRCVDSTEPLLSPASGPPKRVLILAASPCGSGPRLDLERECRSIGDALKRNQVQHEIVRHATRLPLHRWISDCEPHIVHFMGHGDLDRQRGEGVLILENESGEEDVLDATTFAGLFVGRPAPQLVILTSCLTAVPGEERQFGAFSSVAAALVAAGLPVVIAMQSEIRDQSAILFTERFYRALMRPDSKESIESAMTEARVAVRLRDKNTLDWVAPVLFVREDGSPPVHTPVAATQTKPPSQYNIQGVGVLVIGDYATVNQWTNK